MRGWTQTLLVAVTLAGTTIQAQGQPTITLHVENHRGLPRQILDGTRARVEKVYEAIGVHTEWIEGENTANRPQDGLHLTVVLLSHDLGRKMAPGRLPDDVLGLSHVPIKRIYVFCDRIAAVPGSPTMFPVSLGNIIAHEIGHFLLGNGHSRNGIMRANVGIHDLHLENFDETQARTIRSRLGEQRRSPVARSIQQSSNLEDIAWFENREPFQSGSWVSKRR